MNAGEPQCGHRVNVHRIEANYEMFFGEFKNRFDAHEARLTRLEGVLPRLEAIVGRRVAPSIKKTKPKKR